MNDRKVRELTTSLGSYHVYVRYGRTSNKTDNWRFRKTQKIIFYRFLLASFTTIPPPTNFAITWSIYKVNFNRFNSCSVLYRTFPEQLVSIKTIWVESRDRTGIHVITHATVSSVKSHQEFFPRTNSVSVVRYALSVVYGRYNRARHQVSGRFVRECRRYIKNTPP